MNIPWQNAQPVWPSPQNMSVQQPVADPMAKYDALSRDQVLLEWQKLKQAVEDAKNAEMEMRKYIVKRAFPDPNEGVNTQQLGNGYELKATVKFNYKLDSDNKKIEQALDAIAAVGNEGQFIAERLVAWSAEFKLTEYRKLCDSELEDHKKIKMIIDQVLTITDAAPTLEIKEPKKGKR